MAGSLQGLTSPTLSSDVRFVVKPVGKESIAMPNYHQTQGWSACPGHAGKYPEVASRARALTG